MTKQSKIYFAAAAIAIIWLLFLPSGCKEGKKDQPAVTMPDKIPKTGNTNIVAVYIQRNGSKRLDILLRKISISDSLGIKDGNPVVLFDTTWGVPITVPILDSSGHQKTDSLKRPLFKTSDYYDKIGSDSVNTHIENVPVDQLLKK